MKRIPTFLLFSIILAVWITPEGVLAKRLYNVQVGKGEAVVTYLEGEAQVLPGGKQTWWVLKEQAALKAGDDIYVGRKSRLEITLADRSRLRFAEDTRLHLVAAGGAGGDADVKIHLAVGRAWAKVSKMAGMGRKFEIASNNAVTGVRGTVYRMNVNPDASALVRVYEGEVAVTGVPASRAAATALGPPTKVAGPQKIAGPRKVTREEWTVIIRSMQQIAIRADGSADRPREFSEAEDRDDWVDWNKDRDRAF
ncbi:MAG TPA: FecR family protein [Syntrophales bacterium]|jgi:ferric-dicitrate binding protein FerR (iron transport regulator)|nr:FecR family protein [Syntrophales bacterium]HOU77721.1 FecR family protein [Syntrophales bacterium]HQG33736.1 FecR family protein [Syntrophales bacterium]HQI35649.1 FecR family protein [Syntrophales bacterium]HRR46743.1 FecR family protein [Syntrophales bacterium]